MSGKRLPAPERLRRLLERAAKRRQRLLVLGIGNEMLGDDAVGHLLAEELAPLEREGFVAAAVGVAIENAGPLVRRHRPNVLLLIDAATGLGRAPWAFVPPSRLDSFCHSTHSVPLSLLVAAWKTDNPALAVRFIGVTPHSNELGAPLSPRVAAARAEIARIFRECLTG
ncbi:MAG TPA: hydrogenase maturation protease [Thermoanaerobaculaceae bacterium]|nr:hydrogenase maturation protease [Thermoanaerobaculaceae bacterium]